MTLDEIALKHGTDKASSHHDYCRIYERYFGELRDQPVNLLEIGVQFGLSMKTWADYFHRGEIYGVDLTRDFQTDNPHVHLYQGDQSDWKFWKVLAIDGVRFDIVIDDGSHREGDQKVSFHNAWFAVKPGGYYVIEDCFTWWDADFNPGETMPVWAKDLVGDLNQNGKAYHGKPRPIENPLFSQLEQSIDFIHFHRGLMILKRK